MKTLLALGSLTMFLVPFSAQAMTRGGPEQPNDQPKLQVSEPHKAETERERYTPPQTTEFPSKQGRYQQDKKPR